MARFDNSMVEQAGSLVSRWASSTDSEKLAKWQKASSLVSTFQGETRRRAFMIIQPLGAFLERTTGRRHLDAVM